MQFAETGTPLPPDGTPAAPVDEHAPTARAEAFDALTDVMPWAVSILLHLGLILIALFVAYVTVQDTPPEDEIIIPDVNFSPNPGTPITQTTTQSTQSSSSSSSASMSQAVRDAAAQGALSFAGGPSGGSNGAGLGMGMSGTGNSVLAAGTGNDAAMSTKLFGVGGNARRVVYLIDASGSLLDTLPFVITELKNSIARLKIQQEFTVIFFQGTEAIEVPIPRTGLKKADEQTKQRVIAWLDAGHVIPQGLSNPVVALELALRYNPQLIILLSDNITGQGEYEVDQRRLLADIEKNNRGKTKISTIQFLYPDSLVAANMEPTLKLIADQTGGTYKYLDAQELEIE
jgi:hypothetical protein